MVPGSILREVPTVEATAGHMMLGWDGTFQVHIAQARAVEGPLLVVLDVCCKLIQLRKANE